MVFATVVTTAAGFTCVVVISGSVAVLKMNAAWIMRKRWIPNTLRQFLGVICYTMLDKLKQLPWYLMINFVFQAKRKQRVSICLGSSSLYTNSDPWEVQIKWFVLACLYCEKIDYKCIELSTVFPESYVWFQILNIILDKQCTTRRSIITFFASIYYTCKYLNSSFFLKKGRWKCLRTKAAKIAIWWLFLSLISRNLTIYFALKSIWLFVVSVGFLLRLEKDEM